jgi:hypothetical protein
MKYILLFLLLFPFTSQAQQTCVKVDTVYVTAKLKQLSTRDVRFGIKQTADELLSEKYCLSDAGEPIAIEISYIGMPSSSLRFGGVGTATQTTEIGIKLHFMGNVLEGKGASSTDVRTVMIELQDGKIPFSKMTISNAIKQALQEAVGKLD